MISVIVDQTARQSDLPSGGADPLWRAMVWQVALTVLGALLFYYLFGLHGGLSAALGGVISVASSLVFRWLMRRSRSLQAMDTLMNMLRAEAAKVLVIIVGLLLAFNLYKDAVALALVATFIATTLVFISAAFLSNASQNSAGAAKPDAR